MGQQDDTFFPSHHPVGLHGDKLDYRRYADEICRILRNAPVQSTGLTIGVYGEWGIGKSSVLRMVKNILLDETDTLLEKIIKTFNKFVYRILFISIPAYQPIVVYFDAWKYGRESKGIWIGLLQQILETTEGLHFSFLFIKRFFKRIKWHHTIWRVLVWALRISAACIIFLIGIGLIFLAFKYVVTPSQYPFIHPFLAFLSGALGISLLGAFWWAISNIWKTTWATLKQVVGVKFHFPSDVLRQKLDTDQIFDFQLFQMDLDDILQSIDRPIVVLVDDLDRCPPEQIMPVFEMIKYFDLGNDNQRDNQKTGRFAPISFVLAMDYGAIRDAMRVHFKEHFARAKEEEDNNQFVKKYLEKIIQIPIFLPPLAAPIAEKYFGIIANESVYGRSVKDILGVNLEQPRALQQILRTYHALLQVILSGRPSPITEDQKSLVAVLARLQYEWPDLYQGILHNPYILYYLHAFANNLENKFCSRLMLEEVSLLGFPPGMHDDERMLEALKSRRLQSMLRKASDLVSDMDFDRFVLFLWQIGNPIDGDASQVGESGSFQKKAKEDVAKEYASQMLKSVGIQYKPDDVIFGGNPAYAYAIAGNIEPQAKNLQRVLFILNEKDNDAKERVLFSLATLLEGRIYNSEEIFVQIYEILSNWFKANKTGARRLHRRVWRSDNRTSNGPVNMDVSARLRWRAVYAALRILEGMPFHQIYDNLKKLLSLVEEKKFKADIVKEQLLVAFFRMEPDKQQEFFGKDRDGVLSLIRDVGQNSNNLFGKHPSPVQGFIVQLLNSDEIVLRPEETLRLFSYLKPSSIPLVRNPGWKKLLSLAKQESHKQESLEILVEHLPIEDYPEIARDVLIMLPENIVNDDKNDKYWGRIQEIQSRLPEWRTEFWEKLFQTTTNERVFKTCESAAKDSLIRPAIQFLQGLQTNKDIHIPEYWREENIPTSIARLENQLQQNEAREDGGGSNA